MLIVEFKESKMHQKLLTGFTPKALLPAIIYRPNPPKQRVLRMIDLLESEGVLTDYNSRLLEAIATAPLWDEIAYQKFEALGLEIAKEQTLWNDFYDGWATSPENPDNWKK
jgi:hypothetical protein